MKPLAFLTAAVASAPAFAQLPDVAIVAAASASITDCRYTDVQAFLLASGLFASVDVIDAVGQTPTLADLVPYDGVLTWSNTSYQSGVALGDVMADYVDAGGAVVVAVFGTTTTTANRFLDGRWRTGYELIQTAQGNVSGLANLGTINNATHPTVQGVTSLTATSAFRPLLTTAILQGTVIAEWDDGAPLIVADAPLGGRVDLGLYPPSNNCSAGFWQIGTDGDKIIANALDYAISTAGGTGGSIGTSFCPSNPNSTGVAGLITATGSTTAADNNVTLTASNLPVGQFGIFVTSASTTAGSTVGAGVLCLGGQTGRYNAPGQILQADPSGEFSLALNLTLTPLPSSVVSVMAGDTRSWQAWHRDFAGMSLTSNFTNGVTITFN